MLNNSLDAPAAAAVGVIQTFELLLLLLLSAAAPDLFCCYVLRFDLNSANFYGVIP